MLAQPSTNNRHATVVITHLGEALAEPDDRPPHVGLTNQLRAGVTNTRAAERVHLRRGTPNKQVRYYLRSQHVSAVLKHGK